jgi:hypothetical protein
MQALDTSPAPESSSTNPRVVTGAPFTVTGRQPVMGSTPSTPSTNPAAGRSSGTDSDPVNGSVLRDPVDDAATTGTTRSASGKPLKVGKAVVRDTLRDLVLLASDFLHNALAHQPEEKAAELWIASEDEQAGIGDPFADIAERRFGMATLNNPDVADLIEASIAIGRYAARHLKTAYMIRRARKKLAAALPDLPEHPANVNPEGQHL